MQNEDWFRQFVDNAPLCIHEIDAHGRVVSVNPVGLELLGARDHDKIRGQPFLDLVDGKDRERVGGLLDRALAGKAAAFELSTSVGDHSAVFASCFIPVAATQASVGRLVCISFDVTTREAVQHELLRLNRVQAVLLRCNHSLARATEEKALMQAFCDDLVRRGGYCFAWVGFAQPGEETRIRMVAHAAATETGLPATAVTAANTTEQPSACRVAIDSGCPVVVRDVEHRPEPSQERSAVAKPDLLPLVALPLKTRIGTFGSFSIFSSDMEAFDDREVALLASLAYDLAHGIQTLRLRKAEAQRIRRLREEVERKERRRIAATLHDVVGQSMQSVNLSLKRLRAVGPEHMRSSERLLDGAIAEVQVALDQLRELGKELRPSFLEAMPFTDAVRCQCDEVEAHADVVIDVRASDVQTMPTQRLKEQCFLSFREALGNAVRHAKAHKIMVIVQNPAPDRLLIRVVDDGVGFATGPAQRRPSGLGLSLIHERIASVGGRATVLSTPGSGTCVTIEVPVAQEPRS